MIKIIKQRFVVQAHFKPRMAVEDLSVIQNVKEQTCVIWKKGQTASLAVG